MLRLPYTLSNIDWYKLTPEYRNWLQTTGMSRAQSFFLILIEQNLREYANGFNKIQRDSTYCKSFLSK